MQGIDASGSGPSGVVVRISGHGKTYWLARQRWICRADVMAGHSYRSFISADYQSWVGYAYKIIYLL